MNIKKNSIPNSMKEEEFREAPVEEPPQSNSYSSGNSLYNAKPT